MSKRILKEEVEEARESVIPLLVAAGIAAFVAACAGAILLSGGGPAAAFMVVSGLATLFCMLWFARCRRTIRKWRDQERARLDLEEAERIGKAGVL